MSALCLDQIHPQAYHSQLLLCPPFPSQLHGLFLSHVNMISCVYVCLCRYMYINKPVGTISVAKGLLRTLKLFFCNRFSFTSDYVAEDDPELQAFLPHFPCARLTDVAEDDPELWDFPPHFHWCSWGWNTGLSCSTSLLLDLLMWASP